MSILGGLFSKKSVKKRENQFGCGCDIAINETREQVDACCIDDSKVRFHIKVLGTGCKSCHQQYEYVKEAIMASHFPASVEYVTDLKTIAQYGVVATPAIVIDEKPIAVGKTLKPAEVKRLLSNADAEA